jgi:hypothetical protein
MTGTPAPESNWFNSNQHKKKHPAKFRRMFFVSLGSTGEQNQQQQQRDRNAEQPKQDDSHDVLLQFLLT